jgi:hypothetical protein
MRVANWWSIRCRQHFFFLFFLSSSIYVSAVWEFQKSSSICYSLDLVLVFLIIIFLFGIIYKFGILFQFHSPSVLSIKFVFYSFDYYCFICDNLNWFVFTTSSSLIFFPIKLFNPRSTLIIF